MGSEKDQVLPIGDQEQRHNQTEKRRQFERPYPGDRWADHQEQKRYEYDRPQIEASDERDRTASAAMSLALRTLHEALEEEGEPEG